MRGTKFRLVLETLLIILIGIIFISIPFLSFEKNKLEAGDHFANTFAPILSFIGSILVYIAFKAQIKANDKIQLQFDKQNFDQNFFRLIDNIEKRLNNSEIDHFNGEEKVKGYSILNYIVDEVNKKHEYYAPIFGKYILINNPESLPDSIWQNFYNEIDGYKYETYDILKTKFLESDKDDREKIVSNDVIIHYDEYDSGFRNVKVEIFNNHFYEQSPEFFNVYYNHIFKRFFNKYVVFFDAYFKSITMILKHIDTTIDSEFYSNYLNDNLTTYEKAIIWMAVSTGKFGAVSSNRILKYDILLALDNTKGLKAVPNSNYYSHILEMIKFNNSASK